MQIPGEAVDAAAKATFEFLEDMDWGSACRLDNDHFTDAARRTLEAAIPWLDDRQAMHTVATIEELDALPDESVIRDAEGDVYRIAASRDRSTHYTVRVWWRAGPEGEFSPVTLPATVLWEPKA